MCEFFFFVSLSRLSALSAVSPSSKNEKKKLTVARAPLDGLAREDLHGPAAARVDLVVDLKKDFWIFEKKKDEEGTFDGQKKAKNKKKPSEKKKKPLSPCA